LKEDILRRYGIVGLLVITVLILTACPSDNSGNKTAADAAIAKAAGHQVYSPTHDLEFKNYNERQRIADDPTTILWCTSAFPIPSSPLFTIPIVGKLTSGSKRPYPTERTAGGNNGSSWYTPEIPGPDGMYGTSDPYRYGFGPTGVYSEWANMPTYCTTEPTIWQRANTTIAMASDPVLLAAQEKAQALIAAGDAAGAQKVLEAAIAQTQG
jgi:hypothetical protein